MNKKGFTFIEMLGVITILVMPAIWGINGIWISVLVAEFLAMIVSTICFIKNRKKYQYV